MPSYTAPMGHWSEMLLDEAAAHIGPKADRDRVKAVLKRAATEIEVLSGRTFDPAELRTETIDPGGLPFAEVPDAHVAGFGSSVETWPVPDPANPDIASVIQLGRFEPVPDRAIPVGQALWMAGQFVARARATGRLSPEFMLWWLVKVVDSQLQVEYLKQAMVPTNRVNVPIIATSVGGWWFQITRRLRLLRSSTPDDHRLVQPLMHVDGKLSPLVGVEPVLIVARLTTHPVEWALAARIWQDAKRPANRPWRYMARAIHGHGIPIMTIDKASSPNEIACQLLLLAYWHGYIGPDEAGLADAVATAYPEAVERVRRGANLQDRSSAAPLLLEGLLHPGFDPALGAESARRYVNRKATIAVLEHRKADAPGLREWESFGISERFYYKLLKRFAPKVGSRYEIDDTVRDRIRGYLAQRTGATNQREAAMEVLQERGFTWEAARKWLQRHPVEKVVEAHPRPGRRRGST